MGGELLHLREADEAHLPAGRAQDALEQASGAGPD